MDKRKEGRTLFSYQRILCNHAAAQMLRRAIDRLPTGWRWAGLGALSGALSTVAIFAPFIAGELIWGPCGGWGCSWHSRLEFKYDFGDFAISISPFTILPGIIFGLIIGFALMRRGLATGWRYPAFVIFSTGSYFTVATTYFHRMSKLLPNIPPGGEVGAVAINGILFSGLGAMILTALTAIIIPEFRRRRTVKLMIIAGAVSGLSFTLLFLAILVIFILWQASFAAAMSTILKD